MGRNCSETAETRGLSDAERLDNADCYACLAGSSVAIAPGDGTAPHAPQGWAMTTNRKNLGE